MKRPGVLWGSYLLKLPWRPSWLMWGSYGTLKEHDRDSLRPARRNVLRSVTYRRKTTFPPSSFVLFCREAAPHTAVTATTLSKDLGPPSWVRGHQGERRFALQRLPYRGEDALLAENGRGSIFRGHLHCRPPPSRGGGRWRRSVTISQPPTLPRWPSRVAEFTAPLNLRPGVTLKRRDKPPAYTALSSPPRRNGGKPPSLPYLFDIGTHRSNRVR